LLIKKKYVWIENKTEKKVLTIEKGPSELISTYPMGKIAKK